MNIVFLNILENKNFKKIKMQIYLSLMEIEEDCGMKGRSTRPPCGNLVDGLPHVCHTETMTKLARLEPAENDTTPPEVGRVDNILLGDLQENPQKTLSSVYRRATCM